MLTDSSGWLIFWWAATNVDRMAALANQLDRLIDQLFTRPDDEGISLAFVVQQRGEVIAERYGVQPENIFQPEIAVTADTTLTSWSMAKSITHAALGMLVADGLIDVAGPASVPEWQGTDKADITLVQLLEMRSGLRFVEDYVDDELSHCIEMLFGESGPSHAAYAAALPLDHPPGTFYNYSSGTTNIIARIIGDLVDGKVGDVGADPDDRRIAIESFLHERLFAPVGMTSAIPKFDGAGDFVGSSYVYATALDFARFGELYRHDGVTSDGVRILPEGWSQQARCFSALDPDNGCEYGRHWWMWPEIPGSLVCHGHEGQYIVVVPDRELVVVHLGKTPSPETAKLRARLRDMIRLF
jgi:CubicO group peptidase (beta-lactamase class C family)